MGKNVIEVENVSRAFPVPGGEFLALKHINAVVPEGSFVILKGRSGSGKTTLMNLIGTLDKPTEGRILIDGTDAAKLSDYEKEEIRRRDFGFVFQSVSLIPSLSAFQNVEFSMRMAGVKYGKERDRRVEECLRMVGLGNRMSHMPADMSGGEQQRVAIARALVKSPKVLLLDEPLSNLDARLRLQTREEIRRIQRETKVTTIFVTHDQEEAMSISDIIVVMKDGVVHQIGKPQDVYDDPTNLFVAKFLGTPPINVFKGEVKNNMIYIGNSAVLEAKKIKDQQVYVGIRPEGFILDDNGALELKLKGLEVMGRDTTIVSTHENCENVEIRSIVSAETRVFPEMGKVKFNVKPMKTFLFNFETGERIYFGRQERL